MGDTVLLAGLVIFLRQLRKLKENVRTTTPLTHSLSVTKLKITARNMAVHVSVYFNNLVSVFVLRYVLYKRHQHRTAGYHIHKFDSSINLNRYLHKEHINITYQVLEEEGRRMGRKHLIMVSTCGMCRTNRQPEPFGVLQFMDTIANRIISFRNNEFAVIAVNL
jgi:hypothetical protein